MVKRYPEPLFNHETETTTFKHVSRSLFIKTRSDLQGMKIQSQNRNQTNPGTLLSCVGRAVIISKLNC